MPDVNITINVEAGEKPKVEVKQKPMVKKPVVKKKPSGSIGGVLQFPAPQSSSAVLDMIGIRET